MASVMILSDLLFIRCKHIAFNRRVILTEASMFIRNLMLYQILI